MIWAAAKAHWLGFTGFRMLVPELLWEPQSKVFWFRPSMAISAMALRWFSLRLDHTESPCLLPQL